MAIITIIITESAEQLLSGIPQFVSMATSIPSTIFFTFDGTTPDTSSLAYAGGNLALPTDQTTLTFKIFATDGTNSSPVITTIYRPVITIGRQSHDQVILNDGGNTGMFSTAGPELPVVWTTIGPLDNIVDKPDVANMFDGYDGTATGTSTGGTDLDLDEYLIKFSETNAIGERGRGIGTLPADVTVRLEEAAPQTSSANDALFNPRALVIFQDSRLPSDPNILQTNRQYFALENVERIKDGILLNTTGIEGAAPTGSFLRSHFNPRDNTITYYYSDSQALRWIISKEPFTPGDPRKNLGNIVFPSRGKKGAQRVFKWIPFKGSRLI